MTALALLGLALLAAIVAVALLAALHARRTVGRWQVGDDAPISYDRRPALPTGMTIHRPIKWRDGED